MDPNAALSEIRRIAGKINEDHRVAAALGARLAELAEALDEWLSRGGFLPAEWTEGRDLTQPLTEALMTDTEKTLTAMKASVAAAGEGSAEPQIFDILLPVHQAIGQAIDAFAFEPSDSE